MGDNWGCIWGALGLVVVLCIAFIGGYNYLQNKEDDEAEAIEVSKTLEITYSLSDEGLIEKVMLKDKNGVTVVDNKDRVIKFVYEKEGLPRYEFSGGNTLVIYSNEYPSDKYQ